MTKTSLYAIPRNAAHPCALQLALVLLQQWLLRADTREIVNAHRDYTLPALFLDLRGMWTADNSQAMQSVVIKQNRIALTCCLCVYCVAWSLVQAQKRAEQASRGRPGGRTCQVPPPKCPQAAHPLGIAACGSHTQCHLQAGRRPTQTLDGTHHETVDKCTVVQLWPGAQTSHHERQQAAATHHTPPVHGGI
jgi:hypothetical protein